MMERVIVANIAESLDKPLTTKVQVVYFLTEVRKLLEHKGLAKTFSALNIYCCWPLHPQLDRSVKDILELFDDAHGELASRNSKNRTDLTDQTRESIESQISYGGFLEELRKVLADFGVQDTLTTDCHRWATFLGVYTDVVTLLPLEALAKNSLKHIDAVMVKKLTRLSANPQGHVVIFGVEWFVRLKGSTEVNSWHMWYACGEEYMPKT